MNRNRMLILSIICAASTVMGVTSKPKNAWSNTCPFDSYIILDGRCIDLTNKSNANTNSVNRTASKKDSEIVERLPEKTCADFKYQSTAQSYFDRNPEDKSKFDSDNDGYVCEDLVWTNNNILTQEVWQILLYKVYSGRISTTNKDLYNGYSLSLTGVNRIIGFSPTSEKKNNRYVWEDPINNRSIEIRFFNGRIKDMRGRGF